MANNKFFSEFPDVTDKLAAPAKKSAFERKKADDEAKRAREARENEQALADFVKSFGDEEEDVQYGDYEHAPASGGFSSGAPRRHFIPPPPGKPRISGPGSLDPSPLTSTTRKRGYDGVAMQGRLSSGLADPDENREMIAEEKAAPKPTVQLQNLPPRTTEKTIRSLFKKSVRVYKVTILPPTAPGTKERRSISAIVIFTEDTPAKEVDKVVQELHNRYLGVGFNLSISRYLSSAALGSAGPTLLSIGASQPFGAKKVQVRGVPNQSLSRAPPPQAYGSASRYGGRQGMDRDQPPPPEEFQVVVTPPSDIGQLRMIHKTIEGVLKHGEEFEGLLMNNLAIQQDESWAWLFSARSAGGIYYRWKLWSMASGSFADEPRPKHTFFQDAETELPFDDGLKWAKPQSKLDYEFTSTFENLTLASDYSTDSGESDDGDDDSKPAGQAEDGGFLNPMDRAKLVFYLSGLPTSTSRLNKGDIAAITWFVVDRADRGAAEVVDLIIANIETPFALDVELSKELSADDNNADDDQDQGNRPEKEDPSSARLVALYVLSDILFATSTSGIRGAWRYRSLLETGLITRQTFVRLGRLERDLQWGKMKAEKWKRAVDQVLTMWQSQSCFSNDTQATLRDQFENPPLTHGERMAAEVEEKRKAEAQTRGKIGLSTTEVPEDAHDGDTAQSFEVDADLGDNSIIEWDMDRTPELSDVSDTSDEEIDGLVMVGSDDGTETARMKVSEEEIVEANGDQGDNITSTEPAPPGDLASARAKLAVFSARFKAVMDNKQGQDKGTVQMSTTNKKSGDDVDMFAN